MASTQSDGADRTSIDRPRLVAVGVSAIEGAVLLGLGIFSIALIVAGHADDPFSAGLMAGLALLAGAGMCAAAWFLWRGERWPRSPSLVWQLVMLPVGFSLLGTQRPVGIAVLVAAVAAVVALLALERDGG
ncbi:MAG: hypothetical protein ACT4QG_18435 [Sporichthyaceae bacterium]